MKMRAISMILTLALCMHLIPLMDVSAEAAEYEYALFPMRYMKITQGIDEGTHTSYYAIDLAGKDTGKDNFRAPFTGKIKRIYKNCNAVWLESVNKVHFADGTLDYMTILVIHDNDVSNLKVGQVIDQGEVFYQEGTKGIGSGNHVHMEVARGKYKSSQSWYHASTTVFNGQKVKNWAITNGIEPWKALYVGQIIPGKDTIVKNDYGYDWVYLNTENEENASAGSVENTIPEANITLKRSKDTINKTNVHLYTSLTKKAGDAVTKAGIRIWKDGENRPAASVYTESYAAYDNYVSRTSLPINYKVGSGKEVNYALQQGTSYHYEIWCVVEGVTFTTETGTFTTKGIAPTANTSSENTNLSGRTIADGIAGMVEAGMAAMETIR